MYESIVTWGFGILEDITKSAIDNESKRQLEIITETIKTKNALAVKRFEYAWNATDRLYELSEKVDTEVLILERQYSEVSLKRRSARTDFLRKLIHDVHPPHFSHLRRIRSQFEVTNEVISWYSLELARNLLPVNLRENLESKELTTIQSISEHYRHHWTMSASILHALIRITSQDLRFWLSELPHSTVSAQWAKTDVRRMVSYIRGISDEKQKVVEYLLELEKDGGVDKFWSECKSPKN